MSGPYTIRSAWPVVKIERVTVLERVTVAGEARTLSAEIDVSWLLDFSVNARYFHKGIPFEGGPAFDGGYGAPYALRSTIEECEHLCRRYEIDGDSTLTLEAYATLSAVPCRPLDEPEAHGRKPYADLRHQLLGTDDPKVFRRLQEIEIATIQAWSSKWDAAAIVRAREVVMARIEQLKQEGLP